MNTHTDPVKQRLATTDCPRTEAAQQASWDKFGNGNDYMRMIEAYSFACRLERENRELVAMLQRIADAEFDFGEWPTEAEIRAALAKATGSGA